jgi:hypothetical protein
VSRASEQGEGLWRIWRGSSLDVGGGVRGGSGVDAVREGFGQTELN